MSEDIEEIRKAKAQKARELLGALDSDNEEIRNRRLKYCRGLTD